MAILLSSTLLVIDTLFFKGRSTTEAAGLLIKKVLKTFERRDFAQATFCNISRAIDCVEHNSFKQVDVTLYP